MQKHAFISYVRENLEDVDRLCKNLTASGITVWLDRADIRPGARWKDAVRAAISDGAFFVACFSQESSSKSRTYMNEELNLAIDELRLRPTDRAWFIPLKLNECTIPDRAIGGGQQLSDIHHIDLSRKWDVGIQLLIETLLPSDQELINLYSAARDILAESIRRSMRRRKTEEFTIGFTGGFGVGISALLRQMNGFHEGDRHLLSPIARDGVEAHRIHGVGRVLDIRTSNRTLFSELLEREVDVLVYVLAVSSRVHERDLKEIQSLPAELPCLIVVSKWDLADRPRDDLVCETVSSHTARPVVVFSCEFARTWRLMNQMLLELRTLFKKPTNSLRRLLGRGDAGQ